jgi:hypothetical protein
MASVDLLFSSTPYSGQPVNLVFGATEVSIPDPSTVTFSYSLPAPAFSMIAAYDNRVTRWRDQRVNMRHEAGRLVIDHTDSSWGLSNKQLGGTALPWHPARKQAQQANVQLRIAADRLRQTNAGYETARRMAASLASLMEAATVRAAVAQALWQTATTLGTTRTSAMEAATRHKVVLLGQWQVAQLKAYQRQNVYGKGAQKQAQAQLMPWERAKYPPNGKRSEVPVIPPVLYMPDTNLLFQCPPLSAPWVLLFGDKPCYLEQGATLSILPARYYMTINTIQAQLLPGLAEVPIYAGATISQDVDSYGWTLSATGPASLLAQLAPLPGAPKQIRLTINGIIWVFSVDSPRQTQSFGKTVTQITGRSITAAVGPAFARETARLATDPYNAQQLAAQALENTGVTLDWGIEDWLVPAGVWSHYGTPLAAVQAIAQAAGGYVQSHRSLPQLQVRHPYPLLTGGILGGPWNWNGAFAADVVLAPDAVISRSTEVRDSPALNAVYVSGTTQGVLALIKREGTAGDQLGALVSDALIVATAAARQRGLAALGAAGGKTMHQLELPVLVGAGQPGVLSTDQLIQVNDTIPWRGRVRAVSVTAGSPSVRQSVLVEAA